MLVSVGDSIVQNVSVNWLPVMGFVLGVSLAGIGFWLFRKIGIIKGTRQEQIAWISGLSLLIIGGGIPMLNKSIATIFNVQWLYHSREAVILGLVLVCLGYWTLTLFSKLFISDRIWKYIGIFIHTGLFACLFFKFGLGW